MNKVMPIQLLDTVEVLPGCPFPGLLYSKGIVRQTHYWGAALVEFSGVKHSSVGQINETLSGTQWIIPWKYLRVIESAYGDRIGQLEEEILGLESDLVMVRSCLSMSEEVRDLQENQINKLIEDIDILRAELYRVRGY